MKVISEIKTAEDAIQYWRGCLLQLDSQPDDKVAYDMVRVVGSPNWDDLYKEGEGSATIVGVFDLVAELEVPSQADAIRHQKWEKVKRLLAS